MNAAGLTELIGALSGLAKVLVWPLLLAYALKLLAPALKELIPQLANFSFKAGKVEAKFQTRQEEVKKYLAAAAASAATINVRSAASRSGGVDAVESKNVTREALQDGRKAAEAAITQVAKTVHAETLAHIAGKRLLWVSVQSNDSLLERKTFEVLDVICEWVGSTEQAMERISGEKFDVVVSNMNRPPDRRAGYTLLKQLRAAGNDTPLFFYTGSNAPEYRAEALREGATGATNDPVELFREVLGVL